MQVIQVPDTSKQTFETDHNHKVSAGTTASTVRRSFISVPDGKASVFVSR